MHLHAEHWTALPAWLGLPTRERRAFLRRIQSHSVALGGVKLIGFAVQRPANTPSVVSRGDGAATSADLIVPGLSSRRSADLDGAPSPPISPSDPAPETVRYLSVWKMTTSAAHDGLQALLRDTGWHRYFAPSPSRPEHLSLSAAPVALAESG